MQWTVIHSELFKEINAILFLNTNFNENPSSQLTHFLFISCNKQRKYNIEVDKVEEVVEGGKGYGGAQGCSREEEEAEWEDVELLGRIGPGMETKGAASTTQDLRRPSPVKYPGRPRGIGVRGYWLGRRTSQLTGRIKSEEGGGDMVPDGLKIKGKNRVKGRIKPRAGSGPGRTADH